MRASPVYEMFQSLAIFYDRIGLHLKSRRLDGRRNLRWTRQRQDVGFFTCLTTEKQAALRNMHRVRVILLPMHALIYICQKVRPSITAAEAQNIHIMVPASASLWQCLGRASTYAKRADAFYECDQLAQARTVRGKSSRCGCGFLRQSTTPAQFSPESDAHGPILKFWFQG